LVEQPPKKNFQKMLDNDRKILRFAGKKVSTRPEDKNRIFIVSYYLADDTIGIFEPPQRYIRRIKVTNSQEFRNFRRKILGKKTNTETK
jgi:hypothetical protein